MKELHERAMEQLGRVDERTQWALRLDRDVKSAARRIEELDRQLGERTGWARRLDQDVKSAARRIQELDRELEERTEWARRLDGEAELAAGRIEELDRESVELNRERAELCRKLEERTLAHGRDMERLAWAQALDRWFHTPLDRGFRLVRRVVRGVGRMLSGRWR
jgi:chromosome segregation ATPase